MRSLLSVLMALCLVLQAPLSAYAADDDDAVPDGYRKFIVTAYYSPLPGQSLYLRGSYEADIRLNGNGTNGASGKEVFAGMLAAPKTYAFGTRIELSGIGIGIVEDRGGAIVKAGERGYDADRIDIWMGAGEEGLVRALTFGKRTVYGRVLAESAATSTIALSSFRLDRPAVVASLARSAAKASTAESSTQVATAQTPAESQETPDTKDSEKDSYVSERVSGEVAFTVAVGRASDPDHIREVQEIFIQLGLYSGAADGAYSEAFYRAVIDFQKSRGVISSESDDGAGYYGPKTRAALKAEYSAFLEREWEAAEAERVAAAAMAARLRETRAKVDAYLAKVGSPRYGETSKRVRELQKVLAKLGYFDRADTAYFGDATRDSLIAYQLDRAIVTTRDDDDAGVVTDETLREFALDLVILVGEQ